MAQSVKSPGEGNGNPLQYSCLENPMDKEPGGLQSMGSQESDKTEQLSIQTRTESGSEVRHLAQRHTISLVAGSNFKTKFAFSESYHMVPNRMNLFQKYILEKSYYQR